MGCSESKLNTQESISLGKHRKTLIKQAVRGRRLLASAHYSYTISLKNAGAALADYAHGEDLPHQDLHSPAGSEPQLHQSSIEPLPPPPPLPPKYQPNNILRSSSLPQLSVRKKGVNSTDSIVEDDRRRKEPMEPKTTGNTLDFTFMDDGVHVPTLVEVEESPLQAIDKNFQEDVQVQDETTNEINQMGECAADSKPKNPTAGPLEEKQNQESSGTLISTSAAYQTGLVSDVSLSTIVNELDDHFLKASESAREVLKMLEANRMHYHSNFIDDQVGQIDHAALVMRVITWNRSLISDDDERKDCGVMRESDTVATVLDKLRAWEKKLSEEVKKTDLLKVEYQRKVASLHKKQNTSSNADVLEKARAAVSHLKSRYMIAAQSMDATLMEIHWLRDEQLHPLLLAAIDGMATMWERMHAHHMAQLNIVMSLKSLDTRNTRNETTNLHHGRTRQLCMVIQDWSSQFQNLMAHQKAYVKALKEWSKSSLNWASRENASSLPTHTLLHEWHEQLEKLPVELAWNAISSFGAHVETIRVQQQDELRQKEKCEETRKEYSRKIQAFEDWLRKRMERKATKSDEAIETDYPACVPDNDDHVVERRAVVEALKKKVEDEEATHLKLRRQVREQFIGSMKTYLPELFRAVSDFSMTSWEMYKNLWASSRAKLSAAEK